MKKINDSFICISCKRSIPQAARTCRNHCPFCFTSLHVDGLVPGDRETDCGGVMYPIAYEWKNSQIRICFRCTRCGKQHWNKQAEDDVVEQLLSFIEQYRKSVECCM